MPAYRSIFQKIPFIRITSLFVIGILLNHYLNFEIRWTAIALTVLISATTILWHNSNYATIKIQNLLIATGIILTGFFYPNKSINKSTHDFSEKAYFLAEVCQKPIEKVNSFQTILLVRNKSMIKPEKVITYFSKEKFDSGISTGDQIIILGRPQEIKNMGNPFEFDYQSMMRKKQIFHSLYLSYGTYLKTGRKELRLTYWAEYIRDKLVAKFAKTKMKKKERSVVAALTLGYRAELEPETTDYFASTGAMHVLAVSGLHVGLIYFILGFLLSGIKRLKIGAFLFPAIMILFLWTYAFITGFSPSVQRATVMFTFVIIGNILRRPVNIYNSLCAAALFLILHNPDVLFEVGFQLSFLAVFGIVLIQPKLAEIIPIKNKLLKWFWDLLTVSIAAQIATFPLGLFYFNQFPNFFWLSNFFVIPAATIIIWLSFGFFILNPIPFIPGLIAKLIEWTTTCVLWILKTISALPFAVNEGIVINSLQVWITYGIIISIIAYGFSKRKTWLFNILILVIFLQFNVLSGKMHLLNQKGIYVLNSRNTIIQLFNCRENYLITNGSDTIPESDLRIAKNIQNHLSLKNPIIINKKYTQAFSLGSMVIKGNKVLFLNSEIEFPESMNDKRSGLLKLTHYKPNQENATTITIGNTYLSRSGSIKIDHNIKQSGAYCLSLY